MSSRLPLRLLLVVSLCLVCRPVFGATWYVRPDGGTRYTARRAAGHLTAQCDGLADTAYPGKGASQHCAFNDVRFLWGDGTPGNNAKWVIAGGDTVILRGSVRSGVTWRVGWPNASGSLDPKTQNNWGVPGDPYGSGAPSPPSGTRTQHTRILGENYGNCHDLSARTQLHGGYGVANVLRMDNASYVDLQCLDITDFSSCGRSAQTHNCNTNPGSLDDYASVGIYWSNYSTHDTLTDVSVHGMAGSGMAGPTGDGTVFDHLSLLGNAAAGWNADSGNGTTGTGSLLVQHFDISWNGCAEQYPIVDKLPYADCTDDNSGGYGDGFGTATVASNPGWAAVFDAGVVSYNTQDGLDALHLIGPQSSTTVTNTLAFGNMGQQIKVGGNKAVLRGNTIYTSCNALRQNIPGTPAGYNSRLSDFCRAADTGVFISVNDGSTTVYEGNTMYSASSTGLQVGVNESCSAVACLIRQSHNIFIGFPKNSANGYPGEDSNELPNPVYLEDAMHAYTNPGSTFDHNVTYHARPSWPCPNLKMHETDARCGDPHLVDETWHVYGHGDTKPVSLNGKAMEPDLAAGTNTDRLAKLSMTALPVSAALATLWTGLHFWKKRAAPGAETTLPATPGE